MVMAIEGRVTYTSTTAPADTVIDLSLLRNTYDYSKEIKAEKMRKKLLRIRSLGK